MMPLKSRKEDERLRESDHQTEELSFTYEGSSQYRGGLDRQWQVLLHLDQLSAQLCKPRTSKLASCTGLAFPKKLAHAVSSILMLARWPIRDINCPGRHIEDDRGNTLTLV